MAIDLGKENLLQGLATLLIPVVDPALSFLNKGPSLRGAVVFISMAAPGLLLGLMLLVFYPMYAGAGRLATRAAKWETLIHKMESNTSPDAPIVSVTVSVGSRPGNLDGIEPKCEALLSQFSSYVTGSLKIDAESRRVTCQYRGHEKFGTIYAYFLSSSTGAFVVSKRITPSG